MSFKRETLEDGSLRLSGERCSFIYLRPRPGVVFMRIIGQDKGEFGTAPMDELREDIRRYAPVELFIEMDEATGAALPVQEAWTEWFSGHRSELESVSILTRSKFMHFTAEVVKLSRAPASSSASTSTRRPSTRRSSARPPEPVPPASRSRARYVPRSPFVGEFEETDSWPSWRPRCEWWSRG